MLETGTKTDKFDYCFSNRTVDDFFAYNLNKS
eukprot:UN16629